MRRESPSAKRRLVLVVDDDPTMRLLVREALEPHGLDVEEAPDGASALALFRRREPNLVLLDVQMPGIDGFAVCEEIRRIPGSLHTPVVMITGLDDVDSVRRAYEAGATDFITKPISWLILSHRVRYLLRAAETVAELRRSQERLANAQRLARMGNWQMDLVTGEVHTSEGFVAIYGFPPGDGVFTRHTLLERIHPDDRSAIVAAAEACLREGRSAHIDHRVILPDGSERIVHSQVMLGLEETGRPQRLEGTVQDVTERKQAEEQIRYLAYHDSLTGLGNRLLFKERLGVALAQARRNDGVLGVLFLDLDHFKRINDTLGHSVGDRLLQGVADRLVATVRASDVIARSGRMDADHAVSRLGGDEFTILLTDLRDVQDLAKVARRILDALSAPFALEGHEVVISGSIGITARPLDGDDVETLLRNADAAMYHAKDRGRNNYQFYTESMNAVALERLILESKLRRGLEQGEFELHYQPKVALPEGRLTGFEALVRWRDPEQGLVLPGVFIPLCEETGLIRPLGDWVLQEACRQLARWRDAGRDPLPVSVNLSVHQFRSGGLVESVRRALHETGVDACWLELEITESALLQDEAAVVGALEALRRLGIRIAIDDFGTGYSSFSYLRRLPVDVLKIDRSFVQHIETSPDEAALLGAIVSMGRALRLRVIAEGVETVGQRELLTGWGCDEMQGFLVSPAVPAEAAAALPPAGHTKGT
ncbi:MAG TPA: EAL domain-containing protein [Myxococcota bacterium]|nr:EAL domain-containing protein [Myxococcota bacterium]